MHQSGTKFHWTRGPTTFYFKLVIVYLPISFLHLPGKYLYCIIDRIIFSRNVFVVLYVGHVCCIALRQVRTFSIFQSYLLIWYWKQVLFPKHLIFVFRFAYLQHCMLLVFIFFLLWSNVFDVLYMTYNRFGS